MEHLYKDQVNKDQVKLLEDFGFIFNRLESRDTPTEMIAAWTLHTTGIGAMRIEAKFHINAPLSTTIILETIYYHGWNAGIKTAQDGVKRALGL